MSTQTESWHEQGHEDDGQGALTPQDIAGGEAHSPGADSLREPEPTTPEATQPEPSEPEGKRMVTYVVLVEIPGPDAGDRVVAAAHDEEPPPKLIGAWGELGEVTAPTKATAWEAARSRYGAIRRDGARTHLVPERFWKAVTTRERVREPEFVPEGL